MSSAPQRCPNPECDRPLKDPSVPPKYWKYRDQFTLAFEVITEDPAVDTWQCPFCEHRWETPTEPS